MPDTTQPMLRVTLEVSLQLNAVSIQAKCSVGQGLIYRGNFEGEDGVVILRALARKLSAALAASKTTIDLNVDDPTKTLSKDQ